MTTTELDGVAAAVRAGTVEALQSVVRMRDESQMATQQASASVDREEQAGVEYLVFTVADIPCAAPLTSVRQALPEIPVYVPLPDSPAWLLGIFPHGAEILGLVDPAPILTGDETLAVGPWQAGGQVLTYGEVWAAPFSPDVLRATVLVLGDEQNGVALAVKSAGATVWLRDTDVRQGTPAEFGALRVRQLYQKGVGTTAEGHSYTLINSKRLFRDILAAVSDPEESGNG